ncbi:HDOD domain-containing protein [Uliginosibacterium sp. H3]|uniref:HDOD domain-containing protein n=1 Tax=Uliginosibacterium silvisoli TaxID=3114758 RepID=A0ABU6K1W0_9RHOO|nr:HDOD domain-containing protein [Uliginosibacterium sp. H3]
MAEIAPGDEAEPVLLRREVVNDGLEVDAYEFSLRGELHENVRSQGRSVRNFMDRMLIDHVNSVSSAVLRERRIVIPLSDAALRNPAVDRLPARSNILLSPDKADQPADAHTLARISALRAAGVQIWADDCAGTPWMASMAAGLDGIALRIALRMPMEISDVVDTLRRDFPTLPRAAWDVNTMEEFETMRRLSCSSYAGGFITHRGNWTGNTLSPEVMCVATLVNQVREDADMRKIASILRQDMAMSYRLMRYVNAASRGLNHQLSSIEQALMVMGQAQLDRWLTLMMLGGSLGGNGAVLEAALVRARFMELLGQGYRGSNEHCGRLFVLGLFSMLDVALKVPLEDAIRPLNLPTPMRDALLEQKGPLGNFLALAEASQNGDSQRVMQHAVAIGLTVRKVNARHIEALTWVNAPETVSSTAELENSL